MLAVFASLARTALEAVRDPLGAASAKMLHGVAATAPPGSVFGVSDSFAGSCNALFSILRHLPSADGLGFEFEQAIFEMTPRNIALLAAPIRLLHGDFLAPPWADALKDDTGLDLGRTKPPIGEIVSDFEHTYPDSPILYVIEVHEHLVPGLLAELRARFDWSELSIYEIAGPTGRHGVLLGPRRWRA